jgi:hypothetical protein
MIELDPRIKVVEKIIKGGEVRHDRIRPVLDRGGLSQVDSDEVSELVRIHGYLKTRWARGKLGRRIREIVDKLGSYVSAIIAAGIIAEAMAAREFAGSLVGDRLQGFGDNFLFWLGLKHIEISGPDMARAMTSVGIATPSIVKGIVIGLVFGYLGWKVTTRLVSYLLRRQRRRRDIVELLDKYPTVEDKEAIV